MKINMSGGHDKLYVIYNCDKEQGKMGAENAKKAAQQYLKENFPYREYSSSGDEISDCGFWSAELKGLNAVYSHTNENNELYWIYEFDMLETFEYDCWYEDGTNPCPR